MTVSSSFNDQPNQPKFLVVVKYSHFGITLENHSDYFSTLREVKDSGGLSIDKGISISPSVSQIGYVSYCGIPCNIHLFIVLAFLSLLSLFFVLLFFVLFFSLFFWKFMFCLFIWVNPPLLENILVISHVEMDILQRVTFFNTCTSSFPLNRRAVRKANNSRMIESWGLARCSRQPSILP